jgi:DNA-binding transcriptional MerR regulator
MPKAEPKSEAQTGRELIHRAEVRDILGRSIKSIRRYEADGLLRPGVDESGVHWFERREVEKLARRLQRRAPSEVTLSARDGRRVAAACGLPWPFSGAQLAAAAEALRARVRHLAAKGGPRAAVLLAAE